MGLVNVMLALKALEESLEIPVAVTNALGIDGNARNRKIKGNYLVRPNKGKVIEPPCFLNWADAGEDLDGIGQENIESHYTIQIDFYAPDTDEGPSMALAFYDVAWNALQKEKLAANRLSQSVTYLTLRAQSPLLETLEWNGLPYPGFHLFLDTVVLEAAT